MNHIINFIEASEATLLFNSLKTTVNWNKLNYFKRSICHYDGNNENINEIILLVQNNFNRKVIGVFMNYYENGNDYAPYHADKYGYDTCLLSFGETRTLRYKHNTTGENTDYILSNGDLLYIPNDINNNYKHSLLKRTKITGSRISLLLFLE